MKKYELCNRILWLPDWVDVERVTERQAPIVEEIVARFEEGNRLVVHDNPTGGGKSLVAEMVRQMLAVKSTYLTHSLVLQDQLLNDFGEIGMTIKGRSNYIPQVTEVDGVPTTCADCNYDSGTKSCSLCPVVSECSYRVQKHLNKLQEVIFANYAYFFGESMGEKSITRNRGLLVLDEADVAEEELLHHFEISITPGMQRRLSLAPPEKKTKAESWQEWFAYAVPHVKRRYESMPSETLQEKRTKRIVRDLLRKLTAVSKDLSGWIYTGYSKNPATSFITFKPIRVNTIGPTAIWDKAERFLAMSATIISPEEFVESLGYEGPWAPVFAPSTFPKKNRPINYVPVASVTNKTKDAAYPKIASAIRTLLETRPERVLIHSQSYDLTKYLFNELVGLSRNVVTYLNAKDRDAAIEEFERIEGSVLIAPSLQRGYDGKNDKVRTVIVCKVAFPYLGDKQINARLRSKGGELWYCVAPETRIVTSDLRWVEAMKLEVGDHVMGFDEERIQPGIQRKWRNAVIEGKKELIRPCYRIYLEDGTQIVSSAEHRWMTVSANRYWSWRRTDELMLPKYKGSYIPKLLDVWEESDSWAAGYLAAAFDGEGHLTKRTLRGSGDKVGNQFALAFSQRRNEMSDEVLRASLELGFDMTEYVNRRDDCRVWVVRGGRMEVLRFLGTVRPRRILPKFCVDELGVLKTNHRVKVLATEYLGELPVVAIQTSTSTFVAEGFASHNSTSTARTLVQQIGRGVRTETDYAETLILDSQFEIFYRKWSSRDEPNSIQRAHRLFPDWFVEAIDWSSDAKFELRAKQREKGVPAGSTQQRS